MQARRRGPQLLKVELLLFRVAEFRTTANSPSILVCIVWMQGILVLMLVQKSKGTVSLSLSPAAHLVIGNGMVEPI